MGTDHFLGEIVVPLREVEEVDGGLKEADIRRYTLGRRSAKDKVGIAAHSQDGTVRASMHIPYRWLQ